MDCKEVESLLSEFIGGKCTREQSRQIREHIISCPNCREELTIQFLVQEGMSRLDRDEDFHLDEEIDRLLEPPGRKKIKMPFSWNVWTIVLDALTLIVIAAVVLFLLFH
ncbi:MAG: zf-HC2 domain-containing protein [Lachnospiraceae bacterium]|nr:zf-HC2 domain-containing protein [Lachnospiraceae bacterium]